MTTAGSNLRYADSQNQEFQAIDQKNINMMQEPESLMIRSKEKKKEKRRKKSKKRKKDKNVERSKKRRKSKRQEAVSNPMGLKRKATIIVSKKIVRQATERGQSLGEYIRKNKLKLVDPSENDFKRLQSNTSAFDRRSSIRTEHKVKRFKPKKQETKYDSFDSFRKQSSVIASSQTIEKKPKSKYRRRGTVQGETIKNDLIAKPRRARIKKASTVVEMEIKKLEDPENAKKREKKKMEKENKVKARSMNYNDIHIFAFLVVLTLFGVIMSLVEFVDYADSF